MLAHWPAPIGDLLPSACEIGVGVAKTTNRELTYAEHPQYVVAFANAVEGCLDLSNGAVDARTAPAEPQTHAQRELTVIPKLVCERAFA